MSDRVTNVEVGLADLRDMFARMQGLAGATASEADTDEPLEEKVDRSGLSKVERRVIPSQGDIQARPKLRKVSPRVFEGDLFDNVGQAKAARERDGLMNLQLGTPKQRDLILTLQREEYPHASQRHEVPLLATLGSHLRDDMTNLGRARKKKAQPTALCWWGRAKTRSHKHRSMREGITGSLLSSQLRRASQRRFSGASLRLEIATLA